MADKNKNTMTSAFSSKKFTKLVARNVTSSILRTTMLKFVVSRKIRGSPVAGLSSPFGGSRRPSKIFRLKSPWKSAKKTKNGGQKLSLLATPSKSLVTGNLELSPMMNVSLEFKECSKRIDETMDVNANYSSVKSITDDTAVWRENADFSNGSDKFFPSTYTKEQRSGNRFNQDYDSDYSIAVNNGFVIQKDADCSEDTSFLLQNDISCMDQSFVSLKDTDCSFANDSIDDFKNTKTPLADDTFMSENDADTSDASMAMNTSICTASKYDRAHKDVSIHMKIFDRQLAKIVQRTEKLRERDAEIKLRFENVRNKAKMLYAIDDIDDALKSSANNECSTDKSMIDQQEQCSTSSDVSSASQQDQDSTYSELDSFSRAEGFSFAKRSSSIRCGISVFARDRKAQSVEMRDNSIHEPFKFLDASTNTNADYRPDFSIVSGPEVNSAILKRYKCREHITLRKMCSPKSLFVSPKRLQSPRNSSSRRPIPLLTSPLARGLKFSKRKLISTRDIILHALKRDTRKQELC